MRGSTRSCSWSSIWFSRSATARIRTSRPSSTAAANGCPIRWPMTAFKEARSEYNTAFRALQEAQQANRDANAWKPGDSAEEKQVRTTRAALKLHDAEAIFNEVSARVWDNFKATRRTIRAELIQRGRQSVA